MAASKDFFGKRPNWVLRHPSMYGNPYLQSVYTHLRGMNPNAQWKSERSLARSVAEETGFTESVCRKCIRTLKTINFINILDCGKLEFHSEEVVMGVTTTGYPGSQNGYRGNHQTPPDQDVCDTREVERIEIEIKGIGTNVPIPCEQPYEVNKGDLMILGADENEEQELAPKLNPVLRVFDHFNFVARKTGGFPVTNMQDRKIFMSNIKRMLSSGHTHRSLSGMVDQFFQFDRNRENRYAWKIFCTKEEQRRLSATASHIKITDSVLAWVAQDFVREGSLPWEEAFDMVFRSLVHRRGMSVAYRYPDLLASIALVSSGDSEFAEQLLLSATSLIDSYLNGVDKSHTSAYRTVLSTAGVPIPNDLTHSNIRKEAMTLQEAVLSIPRA